MGASRLVLRMSEVVVGDVDRRPEDWVMPAQLMSVLKGVLLPGLVVDLRVSSEIGFSKSHSTKWIGALEELTSALILSMARFAF